MAVLHRDISLEDWKQLPFNLKELQVLALPIKLASADLLKESIHQGFSTLKGDAAGYRDMPVFDIVRRTARRTARLPLVEEVLALCSFGDDYAKEMWPTLQLRLEKNPKVQGGNLAVRRVVDYSSPLLTGERLYELIRFADQCLVDWTELRPNVFFEFGVRLAVHPRLPIPVIEKADAARNLRGEAGVLSRLFHPLAYSGDPQETMAFQEQFQAELDRRTGPAHTAVDTVYAVAAKNVLLTQEFGGLSVAPRLLREATNALGEDLIRLGSVPILFGENPGLVAQTLDAAIESLWASFLFVEDSLKDPGLDPARAGSLSEFAEDLKLRLRALLRRVAPSKFGTFRRRIDDPPSAKVSDPTAHSTSHS
jgi:hypothetical protein